MSTLSAELPAAKNLPDRIEQWALSARSKPSFGPLEWIVLVAYAAAVAVVVPFHEPWADEAQSWLLARDLTLPQIFGTYLHYEGHPGLWHFLLWVLNRLHVSYSGYHWISAACALAGIVAFLRYAPFPPLLRALLPFTFFFAYQYAVIARSYVLFPLLLFAAVALIRYSPTRLLSLAIVLGLFANLTAHGFVIAVGLAFVVAWRERKQRKAVRNAASWSGHSVSGRKLLAATLVLLCFFVFSASTLRLAPDVANYTHFGIENLAVRLGLFHRVASQQDNDEQRDANPRQLEVPGIERDGVAVYIARKTLHALAVTEYGVSSIHLLATAFLLLLLWLTGAEKEMVTWLPFVLLLIFEMLTIVMTWHAGLLFITLLATAWLAWPRHQPRGKYGVLRMRLLIAAMVLICVQQIGWTVYSMRADIGGLYSGDKQAADFLKQNAHGKKVAGFHFHVVGILPYFQSDIFYNWWHYSFFQLSVLKDPDNSVTQTMDQRPDYVVLGMVYKLDPEMESDWVRPPYQVTSIEMHPQVLDKIEALGYQETHRFCGRLFARGGTSEEIICDVILEPGGTLTPPSTSDQP